MNYQMGVSQITLLEQTCILCDGQVKSYYKTLGLYYCSHHHMLIGHRRFLANIGIILIIVGLFYYSAIGRNIGPRSDAILFLAILAIIGGSIAVIMSITGFYLRAQRLKETQS